MTLTRLASGYWHARWSDESWAQWRIGYAVQWADFFNPEWTCTRARMLECDQRADEAQAAYLHNKVAPPLVIPRRPL